METPTQAGLFCYHNRKVNGKKIRSISGCYLYKKKDKMKCKVKYSVLYQNQRIQLRKNIFRYYKVENYCMI